MISKAIRLAVEVCDRSPQKCGLWPPSVECLDRLGKGRASDPEGTALITNQEACPTGAVDQPRIRINGEARHTSADHQHDSTLTAEGAAVCGDCVVEDPDLVGLQVAGQIGGQ